VLSALRQGPLGSLFINAALERAMARRLGVIEGTAWFAGRPVIVTQNDPLLKLFNGDIGIALPGEEGQLLVYFEDGASVRAVAPGRLPNCETALALTIHKSQGSEFERIDIILPPDESPLAARELVYTAVTRARESVRLWGSERALLHAIETPTVRYSALAERLRQRG
jgi:exodeoxyribonuclease V alpha subunit